ncbi:hypothetical protein SAMN02910264_02309 [Ruminococcaceae bacterium YAD3003]|nr:hypothetical protein SAMN02910264_02309 [Ruminococcaceae bacterium YAD3003]
MNSRTRIGISVIQLILLILSSILLTLWVLPSFRQYLFLYKQKYDYAYTYENDIELPNSYYILNGIVTFKSNNSSKAELLMLKNVDYSFLSPYFDVASMEKNEVAVTENIMRNECLKTGDSISVYNPLHESTENYVIAAVLEENYGLMTGVVDREFGVIVFGQNTEMVDNNDMDSVVFVDESFSASANQLSLGGLYAKEDLMSSCGSQIVKCFVVLAIIQLFIQLLVYTVFYILSGQRLRKYLTIGSSKKMISRYIFNNLICISGIVVLISSLVLAILLMLMVGNALPALPILVLDIVELMILGSLTRVSVKRSL